MIDEIYQHIDDNLIRANQQAVGIGITKFMNGIGPRCEFQRVSIIINRNIRKTSNYLMNRWQRCSELEKRRRGIII
jgi:hypothetical protein